ncbi:hypothetical protein [Vibrio harveyi]|uniref:hypothetical protein n=1 Tax=Vibrio harveyi TaxID=669 RepID=UPI003CE8F159
MAKPIDKNLEKLTEHYICLSHFTNSLSHYRGRVIFDRTLEQYMAGTTHRCRLRAGDELVEIELCSKVACKGFDVDLKVKPSEIDCSGIIKWLIEGKYTTDIPLDFIMQSDGFKAENLMLKIHYQSNSLTHFRELVEHFKSLIDR